MDGHDIKDINVKWLRQHIGVVSQEPILFDGSISDNIRLGREGATQADIEEAANMSNAHNFITKFPDVSSWSQRNFDISIAVDKFRDKTNYIALRKGYINYCKIMFCLHA